MRIKVNLTQPTCEVPINNQHFLNGFIHKVFGKNNNLHDSFSNYNISSLQGGKLNDDKKTLSFNESNPYILISGDNDFITFVIESFMKSDASMFGMKYDYFDSSYDFVLHSYYDNVITVSPILLKNKDGRKITYKNENWLNLLMYQCIKKLEYNGIYDPNFKIEIINEHKAKEKCVWVGDVFNVCSSIRLKVYGSKKTRTLIYNMGLGNSTGSGFGTIKIYD